MVSVVSIPCCVHFVFSTALLLVGGGGEPNRSRLETGTQELVELGQERSKTRKTALPVVMFTGSSWAECGAPSALWCNPWHDANVGLRGLEDGSFVDLLFPVMTVSRFPWCLMSLGSWC